MGSLPLPPSIQAPQLAAPAPFQGYNQPPGGVQPTPPNQAANLIQGINAFLEQYQKSRERDRSQSANMAQQGLQNLMLGLPVDVKKLAGHMKKAGMELDFENTLTPGAAPSVQSHGGEDTGVPGSAVPQRTTMPGTPPMVQQASTHTSQFPQQQGGSFWDKVKSAYMGSGGDINPQSPGIAALQAMQQRGMRQQQIGDKQATLQSGQLDLAQQSLPIEAKKQAIFSAALGGSHQAAEIATRSGMMKEVAGDEIFRIGRAAGLTDEQTAARMLSMQAMGQQTDIMKMMLGVAEKYSPFFGNDLAKATKYTQDIFTKGKSDLVPEDISMDDRLKITQAGIDIQKQHPTLPINIAEAYAMTSAKGDKASADMLSKFISEKYPTAGDVDWKKWQGDKSMQLMQFNQLVTNQQREFDLNVVNSVRGQLGKDFDNAVTLLTNKQSTPGEQTTARTLLNESLNKLTQLKVKIPGGGDMTFGMGTKLGPPPGITSAIERLVSGGYFGSTPQLYPSSDPVQVTQAMKGIMKAPEGVDQKVWNDAIVKEMRRVGAMATSGVDLTKYEGQPD